MVVRQSALFLLAHNLRLAPSDGDKSVPDIVESINQRVEASSANADTSIIDGALDAFKAIRRHSAHVAFITWSGATIKALQSGQDTSLTKAFNTFSDLYNQDAASFEYLLLPEALIAIRSALRRPDKCSRDSHHSAG